MDSACMFVFRLVACMHQMYYTILISFVPMLALYAHATNRHYRFCFYCEKKLLCMLKSNQKASFVREQVCCFHSWLLCHGEEASLIDHAYTLRVYLSRML